MTLYLIAANSVATLVTDEPVVRAADVGALRSSADVLTAAGALHGNIGAAAEAAAKEAQDVGRTAGLAEGREAAAAELRTHLFAMTMALTDERARMRTDVSRLALEIVRRIAGELGDSETVAALAAKAVADLLPDDAATVRVAPEAALAVQARLRGRPMLTVVGDAAVAAGDCLIETPLGVSHAGLETQLVAVERAWAEAITDAGAADAA